MSVVGICRCKDEADIIAATVGAMLKQVDRVIVADNGSTDGTRDLLADLARENRSLTVIDDDEVAYYQSAAMSHLAWRAADEGRRADTWIVPFDADELWTVEGTTLGEFLGPMSAFFLSIVQFELYDYVPSAADPLDEDPTRRIQWRRAARAALPKVACRYAQPVLIEQGNHGAQYAPKTISAPGMVRHFPYRSPEQMVRKAVNGAAAYAATSLPDDIGAHWRQYGALVAEHGEEALHDVFREHFWAADPAAAGLVHDSCHR